MGEGLYWSGEGRTAYAESFEGLDPADTEGWLDAFVELVAAIHTALPGRWTPVDLAWRRRDERILARNGLHEVWISEDSYARVHVTFGVRSGLEEIDALSWHWLDARAGAFFDRLQQHVPLRVRTSPWTSAPRATGRFAA